MSCTNQAYSRRALRTAAYLPALKGGLALAFLAAGIGAQSVTAVFFDSARVNDASIHLRDIAAVSATSRELETKAAAVTIGESAPPGFSRFIAATEALHFVLKPSLPGVTIRLKGATRTHIRTDSRLIRLTEYESALRAYVDSLVGWKKADYTVSVVEKQWRCYRGPATLSFQGLHERYPRGTVRLEAVLHQRGKTRLTPVQARIQVKAPVAIAAVDIERGAIIQTDQISFDRRDITSYRYAPVTSAAALPGLCAKRSITAGTILHKGLLSRPPAVLKGDLLQLTVSRGRCRVSATVRAREDGLAGERIWVENTASHKLLRVKVKARNAIVLPSEEAI